MIRAAILAAALLAPAPVTTLPASPPADVLIVEHDPVTGTTERTGYLIDWSYAGAGGGYVMYLEYRTEPERLFVNGFEAQP